MLFNSAAFLMFFLPAVCVGYQIVARFGRRATIAWLAFMSVVFYSWWDWRFVFVLVGSMLVNFIASRLIATASTAGRRKFWMIAGITVDLGVLFCFKYMFHLLLFFTSVGLTHHQWGDIALPLGISFFTFTQIGYLVDLAQGQAEPQNIVEYALFVTFFPHLIAGPIIHHREMMPQFLEKRDPRLNMEDILVGMSWFVLGLAKKCILADHLAAVAERAFADPHALGAAQAWLGIVLYSLQLYFDFSGYSDMAIGLARMFSIRFPLNFNSPYKARNIIDFWQRWHMTLTRWLTLYLYNPIALSVSRRRLAAGKKVSQKAARTVPGFLAMVAWPTLATMFLIGIWHGAGSQFIIFGILHGIYLSVNHAWRLYRGEAALRRQPSALVRVGSVLLTHLCVLLAQIFFRADSTFDAMHFLAGMAGFHGVHMASWPVAYAELVMAVFGLSIVWWLPNTQEIMGQAGTMVRNRYWRWLSWQPTWQWSLTMGLLFCAALLLLKNRATFLYFQF